MNPYNISQFFMLFRFVRKHKKFSLASVLLLVGLTYGGQWGKVPDIFEKVPLPFSFRISDFFNSKQAEPEYEISDVENFLIQGTPKRFHEQLLFRKAYILSYNSVTLQPNWVAWHLTNDHADGDIPRQQQFIEDTEVPSPRPMLEDYRGSGYDRGHMCPAGDNKWDRQAMYESFYLTNMCPQNPSLNSGLWNRFEQACRAWAKKYGELYIVCGPIFLDKKHTAIGRNRVLVPEAFFKVVLCLSGTPRGFGIICRNTDGLKKKDLYFNTIDEIERITGIDFFPGLPDDIEQKVEAGVDEEFWKY